MSIVRFDNVSKQFSEDSYGVNSVSFVIEPGEFMFVTGPSGSGKTTLMRLLLKEYDYTDGEIYFHDIPLSEIKDKHVHLHRRKIGVVFQDYKLIPEMNIWENIALPLSVMGKSMDEIERRVTDLLNLIKLPEKALQFPSQLSGGEAQRVGIARALAVGPELVIADEPTGNLDPETAQGIARLLKKINELGTTVVIATHDRSIIAAFPETRTLALEKGKLVTDKSPQVAATVTVTEAVKKEESSVKHKKSEKKVDTTPDAPVETEVVITTTSISDLSESEQQNKSRVPWWKRFFATRAQKASLSTETDAPAATPEITVTDIDEKPAIEKTEEKNTLSPAKKSVEKPADKTHEKKKEVKKSKL